MKAIRKFATVALVLLLPISAYAQDVPEAVYEIFHHAARKANIAEMVKVSTQERAREIAAGAQFELVLLAEILPASYKITRKTLGKAGDRLQLRATGMHAFLGQKAQPMYGIIDLVREKGTWKVDKVGWAQEKWPEEEIE